MLKYGPTDLNKLIFIACRYLILTYMGDGQNQRMRELIIISADVEPQTDHSYRATYSFNLTKHSIYIIVYT